MKIWLLRKTSSLNRSLFVSQCVKQLRFSAANDLTFKYYVRSFVIKACKNSNITITQCQKNFADCVMATFEFLHCDFCCFISITRCHPYTVYKLNSFLHKFYINCLINWLSDWYDRLATYWMPPADHGPRWRYTSDPVWRHSQTGCSKYVLGHWWEWDNACWQLCFHWHLDL